MRKNPEKSHPGNLLRPGIEPRRACHHLIHSGGLHSALKKIPHNDQKVGVWCAVSARRIIGPIFYEQTVNAERHRNDILTPFFYELTEKEKSYGWFQQDSATEHTAEKFMNKIKEVFEDRVFSPGVWPSHSPNLTVCDFLLVG